MELNLYQNSVVIIIRGQAPNTRETYSEFAVPMYVSIYVSMYVAIRRPRAYHATRS